ncbi:MAG: hypothetical protein Q7I97_09605 [Thermovirgaceae bacterium]|nr:hypothetical protein [Thermovirgaceae bacterium]
MDQTGEKCPFCGSSEMIPVIYGYAPFDLLVLARRGEVILGGTCIEEGQPQWKCLSCDRFIPGEVPKP